MTRTVYVDHKWLPETEARVSVFHRGFLFADAVYEVTAVVGGSLVDFPAHRAGLARSLAELGIPHPVSDARLLDLHGEIVARNGLDEGLVYLQVSRGSTDRDFLVPSGLSPTLVMLTQGKAEVANPKAETGLLSSRSPTRAGDGATSRPAVAPRLADEGSGRAAPTTPCWSRRASSRKRAPPTSTS